MFQFLLHEPFPKVKNPVVQGDKLTNELASLVDVQDIQKILKVIKNGRNGRQHSLRILILQSREGRKEKRHQFKVLPKTLAGVVIHDLALLKESAQNHCKPRLRSSFCSHSWMDARLARVPEAHTDGKVQRTGSAAEKAQKVASTMGRRVVRIVVTAKESSRATNCRSWSASNKSCSTSPLSRGGGTVSENCFCSSSERFRVEKPCNVRICKRVQ